MTTFESVKALTMDGLGIGILPYRIMKREREAKQLKTLPKVSQRLSKATQHRVLGVCRTSSLENTHFKKLLDVFKG